MESLESLKELVEICEKCDLCKTRNNIVFGSGNINSKIVFVGEAPGKNEDEQGLPFVGRSGKLLTDIIEKGMKLKRNDVYICNVIKCRPPNNRNPSKKEIFNCESYLEKQLNLINPDVIIALGLHAGNTLLKQDLKMKEMLGNWYKYNNIDLRVIYHPSYLLRNPSAKKIVWEDVKEILKFLKKNEVGHVSENSV